MRFGGGLVRRITLNDSTLTRVDLTSQNIGDAGARKIAEALLTNTAVTEINLSYNRISVEGARALAEMLRHNATLAKLDLAGNGIGVEGARALAEALPHNAALATLYLGGNGIGAEGARALAGALPRNATLAKLDTRGNGIGAEGVRAFADTLHFQNHSLRSLGAFRPADEDLNRRIESYLEINRKRLSPVGAYIRKTRLFSKSHLGSLTTQSMVLPRAVEHLGHIRGGLSVMFCLVRDTHPALLAFKNVGGKKKNEGTSLS